MLIKLKSTQITNHWESIKFSALKADLISEELAPQYCVNLLLDLLNDKVQCIISVGEGKILRIMTVAIMTNIVSGKKCMVMRTLYSFSPGSEEIWASEFKSIYEYAKKNGCSEIVTSTKNKIVEKLIEQCGMVAESKNYSINI